MKSELDSVLYEKLEILENKRKNLYKSLENLSIEQLNYNPKPEKWSILQIIFHLVKTEQVVLISFQNGLKKGSNAKIAGLNSKFRSLLLNLALKSTIRFKAPKLLQKVPETYDFDELSNKWIKIRKNLDNCFRNI